MLKKFERLSRTDFELYFKQGKRVHSENITIITAPHQRFHASVVVGKKVSKKAVVRNTLRRRIYSSLYNKKKAGVKGIFIVITKPKFGLLTKQEAKTETEKLIERVTKTA